jgi:hypothetical protein
VPEVNDINWKSKVRSRGHIANPVADLTDRNSMDVFQAWPLAVSI